MLTSLSKITPLPQKRMFENIYIYIFTYIICNIYNRHIRKLQTKISINISIASLIYFVLLSFIFLYLFLFFFLLFFRCLLFSLSLFQSNGPVQNLHLTLIVNIISLSFSGSILTTKRKSTTTHPIRRGMPYWTHS